MEFIQKAEKREHLTRYLNTNTGKKILLSFLFTFAAGMIAHSYFYFGSAYSHDSLLINWFDSAFSEFGIQITNGRFLQPLYMYVRGGITSPWINGLFALLFLSMTSFLISDMFGVRRYTAVALISAVLVINASVTYTTATYCVWLDLYMCAFLLSVIGVWIFRKGGKMFFLGIIPAAASIALYQTHLGTTLGLLLLLFLFDIFKGAYKDEDAKKAWHFVGKAFLFAACFSILYYASYYLICKLFRMPFGGSGYQSGAGVLNFEGSSIISLIQDTYRTSIEAIFRPAARHPLRLGVINAILAAISVYYMGYTIKRQRSKAIILLLGAVALLCLPFVLNIASFLAKGITHEVMSYPLILLYIIPICLWDMKNDGNGVMLKSKSLVSKAGRFLMKAAVPCLIAFIILDETLLANGVYLKKRLEYDSTMQTLNRIVTRLEDTEGFIPGETRVAFIGELNQGPLAQEREGFDRFVNTGADMPFSVTYLDTMQKYFTYILNYPIQIADEYECDMLSEYNDVIFLEPFPAKNCMTWKDGYLVFRLS